MSQSTFHSGNNTLMLGLLQPLAVRYAVALFAGTPRMIGNVAFWVPAALVVAAPLALGAWRERGR